MEPLRRSLTAVLALALPACSIAISGPSPDRPHGQAPRCDTSRGPVALDGIVAGGLGLAGLVALSGDRNEAGAAALSLGVAFALSAFHGNSKASACREAFDRYAVERRAPRPIVRDPAAGPIAAPIVPAATPVPAPRPVTSEPAPRPVTSEPAPRPVTSEPAPRPVASEPAVPPPAPVPAPGDPWGAFWREVP